MRVGVQQRIGALADEMVAIVPKAKKDMRGVVREGIKVGNDVAKGYARKTSGKHAKQYPGKFSAEMHGALSALSGGGLCSGEYGPEHRGQGELDSVLENGTRNNPAHANVKRSADLIVPSFLQEVRRLPDGWFW